MLALPYSGGNWYKTGTQQILVHRTERKLCPPTLSSASGNLKLCVCTKYKDIDIKYNLHKLYIIRSMSYIITYMYMIYKAYHTNTWYLYQHVTHVPHVFVQTHAHMYSWSIPLFFFYLLCHGIFSIIWILLSIPFDFIYWPFVFFWTICLVAEWGITICNYAT